MPVTPTEVFQHYTDAWNRHDAAGIVATFAECGTYTDPTTAGPLVGAAIAAYAQSLWEAFPDLSFEVVSLSPNDQGFVSAEWLMKGTNTGPMMGLPPTGRSIALAGADFARVDGGKILSLQGYSIVALYRGPWDLTSSCSPLRSALSDSAPAFGQAMEAPRFPVPSVSPTSLRVMQRRWPSSGKAAARLPWRYYPCRGSSAWSQLSWEIA